MKHIIAELCSALALVALAIAIVVLQAGFGG